ncbi:BlaI/MecI/CopY family transcriptional regulator [Exilibacterium tricleocarpae]|uniref:BlaI/MecI/CopY family transcriptional regulator n=1 Tax=Exilibacterium tricleocarpae TaxID=2591008 RepID=A0A545U839_9GAMM|nr:BlaI/MecI/CopY family transcriptional regulator [Exilibacterium tricleocarpae]TQV85631.1 BlaI/MecI/CopY family transcriptional regulator [Exilibacterium tricleocarpae]
MTKDTHDRLSRRERQIMDILYERQELSAQAIRAALPEPPSYSAVRAMLAKLVDKGVVKHREEGPRYIYSPVLEQDDARASALRKLLKTFFDGSAVQAVNALLGMEKNQLSDAELAELERAIREAKNKQ